MNGRERRIRPIVLRVDAVDARQEVCGEASLITAAAVQRCLFYPQANLRPLGRKQPKQSNDLDEDVGR